MTRREVYRRFAITTGGAVSDAVFCRTGRALFARKLVLTVCLSIAAVSVALAGLVTTVGSALALMSAAVFFLYLTGSTYWAMLQDTVRGENIGGVGGFIHMIANCAGIIGPAVVGYIVQYTGAFTSAFVLAGGIAILGLLCVLVFVKPIAATPPFFACKNTALPVGAGARARIGQVGPIRPALARPGMPFL